MEELGIEKLFVDKESEAEGGMSAHPFSAYLHIPFWFPLL
jgi:hypothetical protein